MGVFHTATAKIALADDGLVEARIAAGALQTLDEARINLAACIELCDGQKRPLLIDAHLARPLTPEVRRFYSGKILHESFLALALYVEATPFGRMMGNIYLRIAKLGIPTKLFADEAEARAWLLAIRAP